MRSLIVIPTYNERENIVKLIARIRRFARSADLLIIDDDSPDGTGRLVDLLCDADPEGRLHVLHRPGKQGMGTAYVAGFRHAIESGYDLVFTMDADFSHDPRYLPNLFTAIEVHGGADLVIGSRYVRGGCAPDWSALRKCMSDAGNRFTRLLLRVPVKDSTGAFRCYRTAALKDIDLGQIRAEGYGFQAEMAYVLWRRGCRIREVPFVFMERRVGMSKMTPSIFVEAFRWLLATRLKGDPAARALLSAPQPIELPSGAVRSVSKGKVR